MIEGVGGKWETYLSSRIQLAQFPFECRSRLLEPHCWRMLCVVSGGNNQSQGDMLSLDLGALDRVSYFFEVHCLMKDRE